MKKIVFTSLILCLFPLYFAQAYTFSRSLSLGSTGDDVLELQKILNTNPATQVSESGAGSPGNETRYFGQKTKDAVIKLQNLNVSIILTPVGLTVGNGFVGKNTRDFLNQNYNFDFTTSATSENITKTDKIIDRLGTTNSLNATSTIPNQNSTDKLIKQIASGINSISATSTAPDSTEIDKIINELATAAKKNKGGSNKAPDATNVDKIILKLGNKLESTNGTGALSDTTRDGFILSPQKSKTYHMLYVGSQKDISKLTFYIGAKQIGSECFSQFTCRLRVPENYPLGMTTISTNDPKFGSQDLEVISNSQERPELNVAKLSLSKENIIEGKNFGTIMKVYTPYGVFETETQNNKFILQFPKNNSYVTDSGFIFVENKNGLQSDILTIRYEK